MAHSVGSFSDPFAETSMAHIPETHSGALVTRAPMTVKMHSLATGVITGTAVPLVVNPIDKLMTQRVATTKEAPTLIRDALKNPYKGLAFAVASNVVKFADLLETKRIAQTQIDKVLPESPGMASFLASGIAGVAETFVTAPFSYIKTQLYMGGSAQKVLSEIPKGKRVQTLFSGSGASLGRNVVFASICFPLVPVFEGVIRSDTSPLTAVQSVAAGAASGAIATLASQPFTVVGTRAKMETISKSSIEQFKAIITNEGPGALWKGVGLAIPRMVVVAALTAGIDHVVKLAGPP